MHAGQHNAPVAKQPWQKQWRELETRLEARFTALVAGQREVALSLVSEALALFDEEVCVPFERQVATLRERVETLEAGFKKLEHENVEPVSLPKFLGARHVQ